VSILIKNGYVIDPSQGIEDYRDILIKGKRIHGIYPKGKAPQAERTVDIDGYIVAPGLVDMHTHLREPGYEYKETIMTGTMAALRGGFTSVCSMPNTDPVNDDVSVTKYILKESTRFRYANVYPIGAITKGQKGEELTEMEMLREAGCVAFSDDGMPVMNSLIMRRALEYSRIINAPIISHCEDINLSKGGVMNEGFVSTTIGLKGIPSVAEKIMVARDIALCELTRGRLHIAHVSTGDSVRLIRDAKLKGLDITAETCPHYFTLTEDSLIGYDTNLKVNPPLRTSDDVSEIKKGLADGTIDVIATDHAPHHLDDKNKEFDAASWGISGLETAFALSLRLVEEGILSLSGLISKMTINPSMILNIPKGSLKAGGDADMIVFDPKREFIVDTKNFYSKGKNSPFNGWRLKGMIVKTIVSGEIYDWE